MSYNFYKPTPTIKTSKSDEPHSPYHNSDDTASPSQLYFNRSPKPILSGLDSVQSNSKSTNSSASSSDDDDERDHTTPQASSYYRSEIQLQSPSKSSHTHSLPTHDMPLVGAQQQEHKEQQKEQQQPKPPTDIKVPPRRSMSTNTLTKLHPASSKVEPDPIQNRNIGFGFGRNYTNLSDSNINTNQLQQHSQLQRDVIQTNLISSNSNSNSNSNLHNMHIPSQSKSPSPPPIPVSPPRFNSQSQSSQRTSSSTSTSDNHHHPPSSRNERRLLHARAVVDELRTASINIAIAEARSIRIGITSSRNVNGGKGRVGWWGDGNSSSSSASTSTSTPTPTPSATTSIDQEKEKADLKDLDLLESSLITRAITKHLDSLPLRYSLGITSPSSVLVHMRLMNSARSGGNSANAGTNTNTKTNNGSNGNGNGNGNVGGFNTQGCNVGIHIVPLSLHEQRLISSHTPSHYMNTNSSTTATATATATATNNTNSDMNTNISSNSNNSPNNPNLRLITISCRDSTGLLDFITHSLSSGGSRVLDADVMLSCDAIALDRFVVDCRGRLRLDLLKERIEGFLVESCRVEFERERGNAAAAAAAAGNDNGNGVGGGGGGTGIGAGAEGGGEESVIGKSHHPLPHQHLSLSNDTPSSTSTTANISNKTNTMSSSYPTRPTSPLLSERFHLQQLINDRNALLSNSATYTNTNTNTNTSTNATTNTNATISSSTHVSPSPHPTLMRKHRDSLSTNDLLELENTVSAAFNLASAQQHDGSTIASASASANVNAGAGASVFGGVFGGRGSRSGHGHGQSSGLEQALKRHIPISQQPLPPSSSLSSSSVKKVTTFSLSSSASTGTSTSAAAAANAVDLPHSSLPPSAPTTPLKSSMSTTPATAAAATATTTAPITGMGMGIISPNHSLFFNPRKKSLVHTGSSSGSADNKIGLGLDLGSGLDLGGSLGLSGGGIGIGLSLGDNTNLEAKTCEELIGGVIGEDGHTVECNGDCDDVNHNHNHDKNKDKGEDVPCKDDGNRNSDIEYTSVREKRCLINRRASSALVGSSPSSLNSSSFTSPSMLLSNISKDRMKSSPPMNIPNPSLQVPPLHSHSHSPSISEQHEHYQKSHDKTSTKHPSFGVMDPTSSSPSETENTSSSSKSPESSALSSLSNSYNNSYNNSNSTSYVNLSGLDLYHHNNSDSNSSEGVSSSIVRPVNDPVESESEAGLESELESESEAEDNVDTNSADSDTERAVEPRKIPFNELMLIKTLGIGRTTFTYSAAWRRKKSNKSAGNGHGNSDDGMGDNNGDRSVAVKICMLTPNSNSSSSSSPSLSVGTNSIVTKSDLEELKREGEIAAPLKHMNICQLLGIMSEPTSHCLVYEFCSGGSLHALLADKCRPYEYLSIALDIASGMAYLHSKSVIHRDLKSTNILLDHSGRAKIADFGLSVCIKNTGDELTAETGTYRWMAPEVIRHESYSSNADVYSFGIVLWQLIARDIPFSNLSPIQAAFAVAKENRRPVIPPNTPVALSRLVQMSWGADQHRRPSFFYIVQTLASFIRASFSPANVSLRTVEMAESALVNVVGTSTVNVDPGVSLLGLGLGL